MAYRKDAELGSLLECPVCYNVPDKSVFNCGNGHSICSECKKKLSACCICQAPLTEVRNFLVESLIDFFRRNSIQLETVPAIDKPSIINCPYASYGCKGASHSAHIENCEYRPVDCVYMNESKKCKAKGLQLSNYFEHLQETHQVTGLDGATSGIYAKMDYAFKGLEISTQWSPFYIKFDGKVFLRIGCIHNRKVYFWIQLIGFDKDAEKYQATITLEGNLKSQAKKWVVPVYPVRCSREDIMGNQEHGVCLTIKQLEEICRRNVENPQKKKKATHAWSCNVKLERKL